jgi:hypothetical protein
MGSQNPSVHNYGERQVAEVFGVQGGRRKDKQKSETKRRKKGIIEGPILWACSPRKK